MPAVEASPGISRTLGSRHSFIRSNAGWFFRWTPAVETSATPECATGFLNGVQESGSLGVKRVVACILSTMPRQENAPCSECVLDHRHENLCTR